MLDLDLSTKPTKLGSPTARTITTTSLEICGRFVCKWGKKNLLSQPQTLPTLLFFFSVGISRLSKAKHSKKKKKKNNINFSSDASTSTYKLQGGHSFSDSELIIVNATARLNMLILCVHACLAFQSHFICDIPIGGPKNQNQAGPCFVL